MTPTTTRSGFRAAAVLATGAAVAAMAIPSAAAAPRDVTMPFPTGGEHVMRFGGGAMCSWDEGRGNSPLKQRFFADVRDMTDTRPQEGFTIIPPLFPFNALSVSWTNLATGATGQSSATSAGPLVGVDRIDSGIGDLEVTVTVTRSALPILSAGSVLPFMTSTHTETVHIRGIDPVACES